MTPAEQARAGLTTLAALATRVGEEHAETIHVRARKAIIVATGGMQGSVPLRTMIDPRMVEPSIEYGPSALMGPRNMDGSGIIAGMKIGANLAGMMQNYQHSSGSPTISNVLGTRDKIGRAHV